MNTQVKQNDGTDAKKEDAEHPLGSTTRSCYIRVVNKTTSALSNLLLVHSAAQVERIGASLLPANSSSGDKPLSFETGFNADFDYWNLSLTYKGSVYSTPYNDRCNISYVDSGQIIKAEITDKGNGELNLFLNMPKSSGCNFVVTKQG